MCGLDINKPITIPFKKGCENRYNTLLHTLFKVIGSRNHHNNHNLWQMVRLCLDGGANPLAPDNRGKVLANIKGVVIPDDIVWLLIVNGFSYHHTKRLIGVPVVCVTVLTPYTYYTRTIDAIIKSPVCNGEIYKDSFLVLKVLIGPTTPQSKIRTFLLDGVETKITDGEYVECDGVIHPAKEFLNRVYE